MTDESPLLRQHQAAARADIRRIELADRFRLLNTLSDASMHFSRKDFADVERLLRGPVQPAAIVEALEPFANATIGWLENSFDERQEITLVCDDVNMGGIDVSAFFRAARVLAAMRAITGES